MLNFWENCDTETVEGHEITPSDLTPYIPKGVRRNLFILHQVMGDSPLVACKKALEPEVLTEECKN